MVHSFIHSVFCLTTGPKPPLKRFLHIVRSRASSFNWEYPLLSLSSSSSFLRLLPCLLVTSISPFIFPSITCFRRQFLRKMWPIQLAFRFLISCRIFLRSLTLSNTLHFSHDLSNWYFPSCSSTTLLYYFIVVCFKEILVSDPWRWQDNKTETFKSYVEDSMHKLENSAFVGIT